MSKSRNDMAISKLALSKIEAKESKQKKKSQKKKKKGGLRLRSYSQIVQDMPKKFKKEGSSYLK